MKARSLLALALLALACSKPQESARGSPTPAPPSLLEEAKALIDRGELDGALAKLQEMPESPDGLYHQGLVWARKAESAPLPTPPPPPSPLPRGAEPPPAPEFKEEELRALELFERAIAARRDHAAAHLAIAELLGPHAARRRDREEAETKEAAKRRSARRRGTPTPSPATTPEPGPDFRPERVIQAYQSAIEAAPASMAPGEGLIRFSLRVGRLDTAEWCFQELVRREKEKPEPLVRYGDFLVNDKKDPEAAIEQYRQAMIWRPDDDGIRSRLADIYINMGIEHFARGEYVVAEARFKEAEKYVTDRRSPQALKIEDHMARLQAIRRPTPQR